MFAGSPTGCIAAKRRGYLIRFRDGAGIFVCRSLSNADVTIEIKGDSKREANEYFYLDLFGNSGNSLFTKNRGLGTILNDDLAGPLNAARVVKLGLRTRPSRRVASPAAHDCSTKLSKSVSRTHILVRSAGAGAVATAGPKKWSRRESGQPHALFNLLAALGQVGLRLFKAFRLAAGAVGFFAVSFRDLAAGLGVAKRQLALGPLMLRPGFLFHVGCPVGLVAALLVEPASLGVELVQRSPQVGVVARLHQFCGCPAGV